MGLIALLTLYLLFRLSHSDEVPTLVVVYAVGLFSPQQADFTGLTMIRLSLYVIVVGSFAHQQGCQCHVEMPQ